MVSHTIIVPLILRARVIVYLVYSSTRSVVFHSAQ